MSDLIDRQAAIDGKITAVISGQVIEAIPASYIKQLQSAQSETCAYWDRESNFCALHRPSAQPERKPGKTLAEEVERIKREITDIFAEQIGTQPEPIKIHLDPELTKEEIERLMRIGDSPVIPPDRQEITLESAIDYLHSIGWMQEHDDLMYKQGYKHGKSKGIKRGMAMARRKEAGGD